MNDPAKPPSPPPKSPPAKTEPKSGGGGGGEVKSEDWREQSEPHPQPPGTGPVQPEKPAAKASPIMPMASPVITAPGLPYAAGTTISVIPYVAAGKPSFFSVGGVIVGSEEAAAQTLRNQLHLPAIKS